MSRIRISSCLHPSRRLRACFFGQGAQAAAPTLYAHYTANCTFSFVDDSSSPVTTVPPGQYQIAATSPYAFSERRRSLRLRPVPHERARRRYGISTTLSFGDSVQELFTVTLQPSSTYVAAETGQPPFQRSFTVAATGTAVETGRRLVELRTRRHRHQVQRELQGGTSPIGTPLVTTPFRGSLVGTVSTAGALTLRQGGKDRHVAQAGALQPRR